MISGFKDHVAPIGDRLFLPEAWVKDGRKRFESGVSQENIELHRKQDLTLQIIIQARLQGVQSAWVGADSLYWHWTQNKNLVRFAHNWNVRIVD